MTDKKGSKINNNEKETIGFKNKAPVLESKTRQNKSKRNSTNGIPKNVANRMARRIAITTGLPTISGMGTFILSYYLISKGIADIPPVITLVTSAGCFFVGLIGLSYGILSASWEDSNGSLLGLENIRPNIKRIREAFKAMNSQEKQ